MSQPSPGTHSISHSGLSLEALKIDILKGKQSLLADYKLGLKSRQISIIGRKEVLTGKAKFGIFGDGKELPQLVLARFFKNGDFRSGYYRDQTLAFATGMASPSHFFTQLYGITDRQWEPHSGGRQMNCHFSSRLLDDQGNWKNLLEQKNSSADISPTGGQMSRLLGLAYASKLYRQEPSLKGHGDGYSLNGNEVAWGTIGDASTSEGIFWETLNAAGVLQVPLVMSVWDDGFGISVPRKFQTTRDSISLALSGFARTQAGEGFEIFTARAWNFPELVEAYSKASQLAREEHVPCLVHVTEVTQPQGHSTSGSHERYKTKERLAWEEEYCCLKQFKAWLLSQKIASFSELDLLEKEAKAEAEQLKAEAWEVYSGGLKKERTEVIQRVEQLSEHVPASLRETLQGFVLQLQNTITLNRKAMGQFLHKCGLALRQESDVIKHKMAQIHGDFYGVNHDRYNGQLYSTSHQSPLHIQSIAATYPQDPSQAEMVDGRMILLKFFDQLFAKDPRFFALGEDVGKLGDVNLVFEGLNAKYGDLKVTDTGIREATILGQGIGAAMRGLRPIVDIQYLDYLLYALQVLSDDLATLHFRSAGGQKSPVVIRTKGHRLEGIWHTGSPIGMILHAIRGVYLCVPRNMTQAAGMYAVLTQGDNPALVIEVLNAYRQKEALPTNIGSYQVALGIPEILRPGKDVTLVTYGACCKVAEEACGELAQLGIEVELIDVQTLIPFDIHHAIAQSVAKTHALVVLDEDVPGGASASILTWIIEDQKAFDLLELPPITITAKENRSGYGTDADFFCKPSSESITRQIYQLCRSRAPQQFPSLPAFS